MKTLFDLCNAMLFVLALIACGGDEPVPIGPETPAEDTTQVVDTVPADTVVEDSTERDNSFAYYIKKEEGVAQDFQCNIPDYEYCITSVQRGFPDLEGCYVPSEAHFNFTVPLDEEFMFSIRQKGFVSQTVWSRVMWPRTMMFDMQPCSTSGMTIDKVNVATGRIYVNNDARNQQATGLKATVDITGGCIGQPEENDSMFSAVTFLPAASPANQLVTVGGTLAGAVAGVAVTPFEVPFRGNAHVRLTLPQNMEGHRLSVISSDRISVPATVNGENVEFYISSGREWNIMMEAKVVEIKTDTMYIIYQKSGQEESGVTRANSQYKFTGNIRIKEQTGYWAESELDFMEERFLTSLFGVRADISLQFWVCANHRFNMVYNVGQELHHITFEAAGRQFRAKVFGNAFIEIACIKREYRNS